MLPGRALHTIMERWLTILREHPSPANSGLTAETLALAALGWVLQDEPRADRLLTLTGLSADELRTSLNDRGVLAAILEFLTNHEPDLVRCAEALAVTPEELAAAAQELNR